MNNPTAHEMYTNNSKHWAFKLDGIVYGSNYVCFNAALNMTLSELTQGLKDLYDLQHGIAYNVALDCKRAAFHAVNLCS